MTLALLFLLASLSMNINLRPWIGVLLKITIPTFIIVFILASNTIKPDKNGNTTQGADEVNETDSVQSLLAFQTVLEVIKDPRCMNCHPSGDRPRQGDDQHLHHFNVIRGVENLGGKIQQCQSCHKSENNPYSNVPGAPHWALAPRSMGWLGLSDIEIGRKLIDPQQNGGRTPEELVKHMTEDQLVLWGWDPGEGREPVQIPFEEFKTALNTWLDNGAYVPE
ncbi:MAG: hypothetical protein R8G66_11595 [Cytophagales bacterium]|nr:hypothetical protein [Cytophagales bacterium]